MFKTVIAKLASGVPSDYITYAQQIVTGDFNGDGIKDVAIPFSSGSGDRTVPILFYLGTGDGRFIPSTEKLFATAPGAVFASRVVTGDFNKDSRTDIYVLDYGPDTNPFPGGLSKVLLSTSNGQYKIASGGTSDYLNTHGAAVGDLDGDRNEDVILFNTGDSLNYLTGDASGNFVNFPSKLPSYFQVEGYHPGSTWGAIADVNNDQRNDLIVGDWTAEKSPSVLYLNPGNGDFKNVKPIEIPRSGLNFSTALQFEPLDLNGDGALDFVASVTNGAPQPSDDFYTIGYLQFLINDGTGQFRDDTAERLPQAKSPNGGWIKFIEKGDVNGDGHADLITAWWTRGGQETRVYLNDGSGHFQYLDAKIQGEAAPILDSNGLVQYFVAMVVDGGGVRTVVTIANDAIGLPTPEIRVPSNSITPAITAYRFFNESNSPPAEKLESLSDFAFAQFLAYKAAGVSRPGIGPYEALGRAYAETASFLEKYGPQQTTSFIQQAYEAVFARKPLAAQTAHFSGQLSYFEDLYVESGMLGTRAGLLAKGAVIGQMLGFATLDAPIQSQSMQQADEVSLVGQSADESHYL